MREIEGRAGAGAQHNAGESKYLCRSFCSTSFVEDPLQKKKVPSSKMRLSGRELPQFVEQVQEDYTELAVF